MMDFGFGAFLEKFEEHFGKGLTKLILTLMGLAITAVTCSLIWHTALEPIIKAIIGDIPIRPRGGFLNAFWLASVIGGGLAMGFAATTGIGYLIMGSTYRRALTRAEERQSEIDDLLHKAEDVAQRTREAFSANMLVLEEITKLGVARGMFSQQLADEILSLVDIDPKGEAQASGDPALISMKHDEPSDEDQVVEK